MAYTIKSGGARGYTRSYTGLAGVDRDGDGASISKNRLAFAENMYRDYMGEGGGVIESVPGFRKIQTFEEKINGIFTQRCKGKEYVLVHTGTSLYRFVAGNTFGAANKIGELKSHSSRAFCEGEAVFILDGEGMYKIDSDGGFTAIEQGNAGIYVPTAYLDGKEHEGRNLLSNHFIEKYTLTDPWDFAAGTSELEYTVTDPEAKYCAVSGIVHGFFGHVNIPRYVTLGGVRFKVSEILEGAFIAEGSIQSVRIAEGVEKIGIKAFKGCQGMTKVTVPSSVTEIGAEAFSQCSTLTDVYLGGGIKKLGASVFDMCPRLTTINYELDAEHFEEIENYSIVNKGIAYREANRGMQIELPLHARACDILRASIDGDSLSFTQRLDGSVCIGALVDIENDTEVFGKSVTVEAEYSAPGPEFKEKNAGFLDTGAGKQHGGFKAITKCTVAERFDGRVFLSGNPDLPNTVFYSERDLTGENHPLYFGVYNYFNDGTGSYPVASMLAVRDAIAIFKAGDDGEGSIFYHTPRAAEGTAMQKTYPVAYVHSGIHSLGNSISFLDDPVFLSPLGLSALTQMNISYERSVATRSHNVNRDLLCEDLRCASLSVWCGYLALGTPGKIYLADSRATFRHETGNTEYEWFILSDIGTYRNDNYVWRYASYAPKGYYVSGTPDQKVTGVIYSELYYGFDVYFVREGGKKYVVYKTEEREGGDFYPAIIYHASGDRLYFGTECGDVCVFNNDMRGIAPDRIAADPAFDAVEYKKNYGTKIHPYFYSFDGHAPRYAIKTLFDNCGIPHLEKNTVKGSLTVKCRGEGMAKIHLEVGTDKRDYKELTSFTVGEIDFGDIDFSRMALDTTSLVTLAFKEKEKRWVEKQITVYSESFNSPIGIYSISYRYTVGGGIKQK